MSETCARIALVALALSVPAPAGAQRIAAALSPDTVRVGDVFQAAVRVDLPPGYRAVFPDSLPLTGDVENAGRRTETVEDLTGGGRRITAFYPLSAWRPGPLALPPVSVRIEGPDGGSAHEAPLPALAVLSVLPADTAGVRPQPPKDVLGGSRLLWPYLLLALAIALAVAFLVYRRRHRRPAPMPAAPPIPPRERALAALDRARSLGLLEAGEVKAFYSRITEAVRTFLDELNPVWGAELTTSELVRRADDAMPEHVRSALAELLDHADLVKFARRRPLAAEAAAEWEAARRWVAGFEWPRPAPVEPVLDAPVAASQEVA